MNPATDLQADRGAGTGAGPASGPLTVSGVGYVLTRRLLEDIDVEFRPGQLTALSGPSGSGKTTLLSIAGGLLQPTTGVASYAGHDLWQSTGDPRPEVAFVLQVYGLIPILSARENVSVALRARGIRPADADERAEAALARFHIADLGDRQVEELSGGQMQRVALARGLCVGAQVLFADEPTSELDEGNRGLVLRELRAEADRGAVVVVATHDPAVVEACDRHYVLDDGRLVDHVEAVHLEGRRPEPPAVPTGIALEPEPEPEAEPGPPAETIAHEPGRHAGPWSAETDGERPDEPDEPDDSVFRRPTGRG